MPVSAAVASDTVLPDPTVLEAYVAVREVSATFEGVPASPAGTFARVSWDESVMVEVTPRSYVLVGDTTSAPLIVSGRVVMLAERPGWMSR